CESAATKAMSSVPIRPEWLFIRVLLVECADRRQRRRLVEFRHLGNWTPAGWGSRASGLRRGRTRRTRPRMAGRLLRSLLLPEWDHSRDLPLVPHLIHFRLEVPEVLFREVREASLLQ